ncbi:MAG: 3-hydroxyacyl-CoA dehydrogenase NAD-binding domain-containing protein, partial [Hydrogenophaga sp.]|nr:3-hydroxyacyl-CoA dehydrogenase NAD-binding domain-containing protein [Hydrogenophaga sp.]
MTSQLLPPIDVQPEAAPFWAAANEGHLLLKHCPACKETTFYPRTHCPLCGAAQTDWLQASGQGTVYSFSIVRGARRPTAVAVVDLPEGPSMVTTVVDCDVHAMQIGEPVSLRFLQAEGDQQVPAFTTVAAEQARQYARRAQEASRHVPGLPALGEGLAWRGAAVVGAGTMGSGIATALLAAGLRVCLIDRDEAALQRATNAITQNLVSLAQRGKLPDGVRESLHDTLRTSMRMEDVAGANLVIEAVWEQLALKQEVLAQIDRQADADALLATNTSTLDINLLARGLQRPESLLGLHFFSPAHVMPL